MDSTEYRQLILDDGVWERTSPSWKALEPLRDFDTHSDSDETPHQHYLRLSSRFKIPFEVIDQWLYHLYYDGNSLTNYGWLDYGSIRFEEVLMSANCLANLNVVSRFAPWVKGRQLANPFDDFCCRDIDKTYWREKGTWRTAPIVLDVSTLNEIPDYADVNAPYQLVEGHTRLGYLLAMLRAGLISGDSEHRVYRMYLP